MINGLKLYGAKYFGYAHFFREIAFEIETNPDAIMQYADHPAIQELIYDETSTCLERVQRLEALCYGDAGVMLACPGPSLSGIIMREIGSVAQKKLFFEHVQSTHARTLFAVTEPKHGSNANNIETSLIATNNDNYQLSGEKCLFGNGYAATIGVVLAKQSTGPLGMQAILLPAEKLINMANVSRKKLQTSALKGAQLSYIEFNKLEIEAELILGRHLNPIKSGLMAVITTFNRMRPAVAAIALGHAQAIYDYIIRHTKHLFRSKHLHLDAMLSKLRAIRCMLHKAAFQVEKNPLDQANSSIVKLLATKIAEELAQYAVEHFGVESFTDHPFIAKWTRDVYAFEFMEGTTNMHLQNIYTAYKQSAGDKLCKY